jgi:hypothetical protein
MTTETNHIATTGAEPDNRWNDHQEPVHDELLDAEAAPEPQSPSVTAEPATLTEPVSEAETPEAPVQLHGGGDPLLTAEAESELFRRWNEIQVSFVEDPHLSVQDADTLIQEITAALVASFEERRSELAAGWQQGQPDTEDLRLALRQYRSFIGVVLPR